MALIDYLPSILHNLSLKSRFDMTTPVPAAPLIPQAAPFLLVDTLISATPEETHTSFTIPENHVLVENGVLSESGLVENMAQSAAAGMGFLNRSGGAPKTGFIGALKNLMIHSLPQAGALLNTTVAFRHQVMSASIVFAEVYVQEVLIASCELKIFIQESE